MSGLEIAGVVLGVIPIIQIVLEHFHGDRFKTLVKYQHMIRSISRKLEIEQAQFHSTCEKLLSPLVAEDRLAELLASPKGSKWKDADLEEDLRDHLGDKKYELYVGIIEDLAGFIISLKEDLGLADMERNNSERWYEKAAKRLKSSLKHKKHISVLEDIKECNVSLHRLVGDVLEMTPIRTNRRTKLDARKWESLRKLAESLHSILEEGLSCDCGHCHMAHLRLESRNDRDGIEVRFGVLFSLDAFPRGWQETEITIAESESSGPSPPPSDNSSPRVRWGSGTSDQLDTASDVTSEATAISPTDHRIDDLCQELLKKRKEAGCIGFLDDELHREYYIHSVYPPTTLGDDISLAQLLSRKESGGNPALLGRDKYELAVILATSILQLHSTPWMNNSNWKEDVRFVRAKGKNSPFAYIQRRFDGHVPSSITVRRDSLSSPIRNETIFALGITLIELSLGRSLRYFQTEDDLGPDGEPNFLTDLSIAQRLVMEQVQEKEGARYANTVNRCINCIFDGFDPSLEDEQFRQAFYQSAVIPLKEVRDDFIK